MDNVSVNVENFQSFGVNDTISVKEDDIVAIFNGFVTSDKLSNARQILQLLKTGTIQKIPDDVKKHAVNCASNSKSRSRLRELCFHIIECILPEVDLKKESKRTTDLVNTSHILLVQGPEDGYNNDIIENFVSSLTDANVGLPIKIQILSFLSRISSVSPSYLSSDLIQKVSSFMIHWLHASSSSEEFTHFTELDGSPALELFTVLNLAQSVNNDQMLHVQVFSMLRLWFEQCHGISTDVSADKLRVPLPSGTINKVMEYCLRLIEQCNRAPAKSQDSDLQRSCFSEALKILTMLCALDASLVPVIHQTVRQIYMKYCPSDNISYNFDCKDVVIVTDCVQFFVNHGATVGFDINDVLTFFFKKLIEKTFTDFMASLHIVSFLKRNVAYLCYNGTMLEDYFPSVFKIICWHPQSFIESFVEVVPAAVSTNTAVEVFHTLLDLPCVTAALSVQQLRVAPSFGDQLNNITEIYERSLTPSFKPMFNFILRCESGSGDTFSRIGELHNLLRPVFNLVRVKGCANTVTVLLRHYFKVVLLHIDKTLANRLVPAILDRLSLLPPIPEFTVEVQEIVQDAMLKMLKTYPELMVVHRAEITDYVAVVRNFTLSSNFYINMVWAFGEYTSPTYVDNCRAEMITTIYETLECILFEIYSVLEEKGNYFVLTCVLATALAKLASRCQDLVPRVILCLSKIVIEIRGTEDDDHEYRHIVVNRLNELIAVLKMPNAAAIIMSPPKNHDERKWHRDNCSIEMFVKTINVVLTDST